MPLPYAGRPGKYDPFSPTLIPNFNRPFMVGQPGGPAVLAYESPAQAAISNPQVNATANITVGGTPVANDTSTVNILSGQLPNGEISYTYTQVSGDTTATVAEGLASGLNAALEAAGIGNVFATTSESTLTLNWVGPMGNNATFTTSSTGATLTASGSLSGGSGPVYCTNNFNFFYNGAMMSFYYGEPYILGSDLLSAMAAQDMPMV